MGEADVTELVKRLTSHSEALERHTARIQQAFDTMQESLANLKRVWQGEAAEWFYAEWARSMDGVDRWLEGARQIKMLLDDRLNSLRAADLPFEGSPQQLGLRFPLSAADERGMDTAQGYLRAVRRRDGIPLMNERQGTREFTRARLDMGGGSFDGRSDSKKEGELAPPPPGVPWQVMRHAEAHAITQAKRAGVTDKVATLHIDREPCDMCKPALPKLARWLGVEKLRVFTPDGLFGEY